MRILKQLLKIKDVEKYLLPGKTVRPIAVIEQRCDLVLYFETDTTPEEITDGRKRVVATVYIAGTGHFRKDIPANADYIGTVAMSYGCVWHCYVKTEAEAEKE